MLRKSLASLLALPAMLLAVNAMAAQPADHPLVGRFEDSKIVDYQTRAFDEYVLLTRQYTGHAEWGEAGKKDFGETLEGKITRITYESPRSHSTLEVMRAYEEALKGNGFDILFQCADQACGGRRFNLAVIPYNVVMSENQDDQRYIAARESRPDKGDVSVAIYTVKAANVGGARKNRVYTQVDVIEEKPRETKVIVVKAHEMAQKIDESGSVALYGLYFATDEAAIKPESRPTLDQIGKLLQNNPDLKLLVVGHTDNRGGFDYNIDLSRRRAASVTEALVEDYGIDRDRLKPWGVGYTAPVASNATAEGRAQNRRVELVAR